MLFRCNILALVGGGPQPKVTLIEFFLGNQFPPNKVMIWDDYQNKCIAELEFRSEVKAVKLRRDRIVVVLDNKVYVYNFADLQLLGQIETCSNPRGFYSTVNINISGLCSLSPGTSIVLAAPGQKPGTVHIELYDTKQTQTIQAHNNPLTQIVLNLDGTRLATASEKGTLIRIWDTKTGNQLKEFRRGADKAEIYSLAFSPLGKWICVSSDKGTVHVYGLNSEENPVTPDVEKNKTKDEGKVRHSSLAFMKDILPSYFSSEWSFAQFHVPDAHSLVCFGENSSIIVVCADGTYYRYNFDAVKGGECKQESSAKYLKA